MGVRIRALYQRFTPFQNMTCCDHGCVRILASHKPSLDARRITHAAPEQPGQGSQSEEDPGGRCLSPMNEMNESAISQAFAHASEDLAALDKTFEHGCAFRNNDSLSRVTFDSSLLSQEEYDACTAGARIALKLPLMTKLSSWGDGIIHGCPHIHIDMKKAMGLRYGNYCRGNHAERILQELPAKPKGDAAARATTDERKKKRVLIILFGLHRFYRDSWAHMQDALVNSNPNVAFSLALLTWPLFTCTDRDRHPANDECIRDPRRQGNASSHSRVWLRCDGPLPELTNFTLEMERFYASGPTPVPLVYTQYTHFGMGAYRKPHSVHRLSRGWAGLLALGIGQRFDHVIAMRPDSILSRPLLLGRECAPPASAEAEWRPGLRILSGAHQSVSSSAGGREEDKERSGSGSGEAYLRLSSCPEIRESTWDFGLLACDPRALSRWLYPSWNDEVACYRTTVWDNKRVEFVSAALAERDYKRFGACEDVRPPNKGAAAAGSRSRKSWVEPDVEYDCAVRQLFRRSAANPQRLHLGNADASGTFLVPLANRTDQGWSPMRPKLVCSGESASVEGSLS